MDIPDFKSLPVRESSYSRWPLRDMFDVKLFALAGFYYPGLLDLLVCAYCHCQIANWTLGDDPWKEHAKAVPRCIHVMCCKGKEYIKSVISVEESGHTYEYSQLSAIRGFKRHSANEVTLYGIKGPFQFQQQCSSNAVAMGYRTPEGIPYTEPLCTEKGDASTRLATFDGMPDYLKLKLDCNAMAASGLYYEGAGDNTRCYYCGHGFRNWERDDKPWEEHARHVPCCFHIILSKGEQYGVDVRQGEDSRRQYYTGDAVNQTPKRKREDALHPGESSKKYNTDFEFGREEQNGVVKKRIMDKNPISITASPSERQRVCRCCIANNGVHGRQQMMPVLKESTIDRKTVTVQRSVTYECDANHKCVTCRRTTDEMDVYLCCKVPVCNNPDCHVGEQCPQCCRLVL